MPALVGADKSGMICLKHWEGKMNQNELRRGKTILAFLVSLSFSFGAHLSAQAAETKAATTADTKPAATTPAAASSVKTPAPQEMPQTAFEQSKLAPDKRDAIKRLMTVTRLPQVANGMYDMLLSQGQKSFEMSLARSIEVDMQLTDDQKRDLMQKAVGSTTRMFARYRELLPKEINLPDVLESVSTKVYDKYFSAKELNDISDFYQTPAGKKALDVLPQVMQESAQMTGEIVTPKVKQIVAQILQEERANMVAAPAKTPATAPAKAPEAPKNEAKK
jgi:hypothetical protein